MDLRGYLRAIRLNWWIVVLLVVLGATAGVLNVHRSTRVYAGHVTFFVASPGSAQTSSVSGDLTAAEDLAVSYARLLSSDRLAVMIADSEPDLKLDAGAVAARVSGAAELNTVLLNATVRDTSRPRLQKLTRAVAVQFPRLVKQLNSSSSDVTLNVTSGPTVGTAPISPRSQLQVGLGVLVGLLLGLALAVVRYLLDTSLRSSEAVSDLTGQPAIGSIPFDVRARRAPLVNAGQEHTPRAEAYRQVRTNLQFINVAHPVGIVVISSAVEAEGKSSAACNLALVFAETGRSVLLIEADLRRPRISEYLGLERAVGLTNVLAEQVDLAEVTQQWGDTTLRVLPSGGLPPNPSELLGSRRMSELLVRLRREYDLVIIDTPPLLPVTDAAVLATQVDGVVLIARAGRTRRGQVHTAIQALDSVNARLLGVVLNMTRRGRPNRYGYTSHDEPAGTAVETAPTVLVRPAQEAPPTFAYPDAAAPIRSWDALVAPPADGLAGGPPAEVLERSRKRVARHEARNGGSRGRRRSDASLAVARSEGADHRGAGGDTDHGGDVVG